MTEDYLHYTWKFKLFDQFQLQTTCGLPVEIIDFGQHNHNAGPDFLTAQVRIGTTLWAGNVEIHTKASDWNRHKHQFDEAYDNVILHVVFDADADVQTSKGQTLPVLELKHRMQASSFNNYEQFVKTSSWVPCANQLHGVDPILIESLLHRMLVSRLETKTDRIVQAMKDTGNDWETAFYRLLARNFGFKTNSSPFEMLSYNLPLKIIAKQKSSPLQIEALIFGQAGLLEKDFEDEYPQLLQREYRFLQSKYKLQPMPASAWKFSRMRPNNFPTIRLAQFAAILQQTSALFSHVLEAESLDKLFSIFDVEANEYWDNHYTFDKVAKQNRKKRLGQGALENVVINSIAPLLFHYGKQKHTQSFCDRAIAFLELLKGEQNHIVKKWQSLGMPSQSAFHTQALLQLKDEFCSHKKCLNCHIGVTLLKN